MSLRKFLIFESSNKVRLDIDLKSFLTFRSNRSHVWHRKYHYIVNVCTQCILCAVIRQYYVLLFTAYLVMPWLALRYVVTESRMPFPVTFMVYCKEVPLLVPVGQHDGCLSSVRINDPITLQRNKSHLAVVTWKERLSFDSK